MQALDSPSEMRGPERHLLPWSMLTVSGHSLFSQVNSKDRILSSFQGFCINATCATSSNQRKETVCVVRGNSMCQ